MASPVRFPQGLSTFPPRSILGTYPVATSPTQIAVTEDFIPYLATDYTVSTAVAGTVATFPFQAGAVKLATSASATDTIWLARNGQGFQFMPLNQMWFDVKLAYPRSVLNANDTNIYAGLFDNVVPTSANNGVYFIKPTGGTTVNLVIKKGGTSTTFQNIADLSLPSGLYGDTNSVNGTLNATIAGTAFTATSVATAGAGYQCSPLVLSTSTAAGTVGSVPVSVSLGSTATSQTNPQYPIQTTSLPYGSLYQPIITNPGTGFTNNAGATTLLEVEPFIDLQFWYNGKDTLYVGVNGSRVLSIGSLGVGTVAAGNTINVATATGTPSFYSTTQLTSSISPVQPALGSAYNLVPQVPMQFAAGFANTTVNIRTLYLAEYNVATEFK